MHNGVRQPAFQSAQPPAALPIDDDPSPRLERMYRRIWETSMQEMGFVNRALEIEAIGFRRWPLPAAAHDNAASGSPSAAAIDRAATGDWVGALITPWFLNLFLLPGGGHLWCDRRPGQRHPIEFPIGPLVFIADYDGAAEVPHYQYCPLFAPPSGFASHAAARAAATAALAALVGTRGAQAGDGSAPPTPPQKRNSRRSFFKRVASG